MKKSIITIVLILSISIAYTSCRDEKKTPDEKIEEVIKETKENLKESKEELSEDVEDALEDIEDEINEVKEKSK